MGISLADYQPGQHAFEDDPLIGTTHDNRIFTEQLIAQVQVQDSAQQDIPHHGPSNLVPGTTISPHRTCQKDGTSAYPQLKRQ